ncbi:hypothetical protein RA27_15230 [Ruegeria sp. ANG-R]|uniref:hypothetical protein n=1 Tax=Ruegeria sp. ANG-R TaxID=1577903 RepID=UPI00057FF62C|nr:hypothetical protein [Ruegeria sp. ANG-R]KIC40179.1 hypothetical protein RA27_15230 [Ruegeria sp. ANG-R]
MIARFQAWRKQPSIRRRLRITGLLLLLIGVGWSVSALDLTWSDLSLYYVALNVCILTPALLFVAAITFRFTAASASEGVSTIQALRIVAHANVAELLPLPGGALVRGAALVDAGASAGVATRLVLLTALLTLGLTIALSSAALVALDHRAWVWLTMISLTGVAITLFLLSRQAEARLLAGMVVIRLVSFTLSAARLVLAFAALGHTATWLEAALYTVAPSLGATVGIFPAGLGLNEAVAAGLAKLIASAPAPAFLAVALNRVLGLAVGAAFVFVAEMCSERKI